MFYRYVKCKTASTRVADGQVEIDLTKPDERLRLDVGGPTRTFKTLEALLSAFPQSRRSAIKQQVVRATRGLFADIERRYPDSTWGVMNFLAGRGYQIPGLNLRYQFDLAAKHDTSLFASLSEDSDFDPAGLSEIRSPATWPSTLEIAMGDGSFSSKPEFLFDPYALVDIYFGNLKDCVHSISLTERSSSKRSFSFSPSSKHNRVRIETAQGRLVVEYDRLQMQLLACLNQFAILLKDLHCSCVNVYTLAFVVGHWTESEDKISAAQLRESNRLLRLFCATHEAVGRGFLPTDHSFLQEIALEHKLLYTKQPCGRLEDLPPRYVDFLTTWSKSQGLTPEALFDKIKSSPRRPSLPGPD
jgi:hypothetical protein